MDPVRSMQNLMAILNQPNLLVRTDAILDTCYPGYMLERI
jgi:hypothetical protein